MRRQPNLPDGLKRIAKSTCMPPEMERWVAQQMRTFKCGASWVIVVAISEASGIDVIRPDEDPKRPLRKRRVHGR